MTTKPKPAKFKKRILPIIAGILCLALLAGGLTIYKTKSRVQELFELNQTRKAEGYYLAEFEFKMLGAAYYLDQGEFLTAWDALEGIHHELATAQGLAKQPVFHDIREKIAFYRSLQNPETGAFFDDVNFPLFTFIGPTANMIEFIEVLSREAGEAFRLDHPLTFLDRIAEPGALRCMLEDCSHVGWIGAKFKTPFVCIAELGELAAQCERLGLYTFSPEWKQTFYEWFYENQDPVTGLWGSRWRDDNTLVDGGSLSDSEKVIKLFVDLEGNDRSPDYPLKRRKQLVLSALAKLTEPAPDTLDELHEWILVKDRGFRFLTRYLWRDASASDRQTAEAYMKRFIHTRFANYFVADEGAFSLYPGAENADLDGTGEAIGMFKYLGTLSPEKQKRIWKHKLECITDRGERTVGSCCTSNLVPVAAPPGVNSVRFYAQDPEGRYLENVIGVWYPFKPEVLDAVDVLSRVRVWAESTPQNMGNWVSREKVLKMIDGARIPHAPLLGADAVETLAEYGRVVAVGFDTLQVPISTMTINIIE